MVRLVMNSLPLLETLFRNIEFDGVVASSDGLDIVVKLAPNLSDLDVVVVDHGEQGSEDCDGSNPKSQSLHIFEFAGGVNARHLHEHDWRVFGISLALSWGRGVDDEVGQVQGALSLSVAGVRGGKFSNDASICDVGATVSARDWSSIRLGVGEVHGIVGAVREVVRVSGDQTNVVVLVALVGEEFCSVDHTSWAGNFGSAEGHWEGVTESGGSS